MPKTCNIRPTADLFLPFAPTPRSLPTAASHDYLVIGRLREGVTPAQAQAEMNRIARPLAKTYPATNLGWSVKVEPLLDDINGDLHAAATST